MEKEFHTTEIRELPNGDVARLDFRWVVKRRKIKEFAINLSLVEGGKSVDVFRVDTMHGYLHEQRFWISPRPEPLDLDYSTAFVEKKGEVFEKYVRWINLFRTARKKGEING